MDRSVGRISTLSSTSVQINLWQVKCIWVGRGIKCSQGIVLPLRRTRRVAVKTRMRPETLKGVFIRPLRERGVGYETLIHGKFYPCTCDTLASGACRDCSGN